MKRETDVKNYFRQRLMDWYEPEDRPMPWKESKNIYHIWLSEIMLQQTRVDQMLPYFERFVDRFPDVYSLAEAGEDEVLKYWEGLGYYSRARNLHKAAGLIAERAEGDVPRHIEEWMELPGVGPYTAAAITSFVYGDPNAVLDGNVFRVLARFFGLDVPIDTSQGKKVFSKLADQLICQNDPAIYNQAIMDFGATVCKPANPLCETCPVSEQCVARLGNLIAELPVKSRRPNKKKWKITYCHLHDHQNLLLVRRPSEGVWGGLYELPAFSGKGEMVNWMWDNFQLKLPGSPVPVHIRHELTHRRIEAEVFSVRVEKLKGVKTESCLLVSSKKLPKFALHSLMKKYFAIFTSD